MKRKNRTLISATDILRNNEARANIVYAYFLLVICGVCILSVLSVFVKADSGDSVTDSFVRACVLAFSAVAGLLTVRSGGRSPYSKNLLTAAMLVITFVITVPTVYGYSYLLLCPVIMSVVYCDEKFTLVTGLLSYGFFLVSRVFSVLFGFSAGYYDLGMTKVPDGAQITFENGLVRSLADAGYLNSSTVVFTETAGIILHSIYFAVIIGVCVVISERGASFIAESEGYYEREKQAEKEAEEAKTRVFMSQLRPHFLYNSLSAIMAIDGNPPETVEALGNFAKYLRGNLDSLVTEELIPFETELDHIERYASLEKLRFKERLGIEYEIDETAFFVPPLTVQMAVENAIKHGITKKPGGGTVTIRTESTADGIKITVSDDGVGFDPDDIPEDDRTHIGIDNIKSRIADIAGGKVSIISAEGIGTVVEIELGNDMRIQ